MRTRIGLIGPEDSVARIRGVAAEFEGKVDILEKIYAVKEESIALVRESEKDVDVFLFSGIIPYKIVTYARVTDKPCVFIPRLGTSVIKALWEMRNDGADYGRISVDSIDRRDIEEAAEELGFGFTDLEVIEYEEGITYEALAELHRVLYERGTTAAALTGLTKTYQVLRDLGVRCYKTYPTKYLIREYVQKALHIAETSKMMAYQIAVIILKIRGFDAATTLWYDRLRVKNAFEKILIDYTKKIFGSMFPFGRDEYIVFTTRGTMEDMSKIEELLDAASSLDIEFSAGLGYGATAFNAEYNARLALTRSCSASGPCMFAVDVDGGILGPVASRRSPLRYNISESDAGIRKVAEDTGLSPSYVSKIKSLIRMTRKNRFDAEELSAYLDISSRSARRILRNIEEAGHAKIVALESKSTSGRPRRVYELTL